VDLFVNFLGQDKVVELKMLGGGYGIGHAKGELNQLDEGTQLRRLSGPGPRRPEGLLNLYRQRLAARGRQEVQHPA
jgi:hypothetical protein